MAAFDKEMVRAGDAVELLRLQKHDFLNHMQLVSGFLQLGNLEKAKYFLQKASHEIETSGTIMGLAHPALSINLLLRVHNAYKRGVTVALSTGTDLKLLTPDSPFKQLVDQVFSAIEEVYSLEPGQHKVQIIFSEDEANYYMVVTALPFQGATFNLLVKQVEEAAAGFLEQVSVRSLGQGNDRQLQVCFSINTRSV